MRAIVDSEGGIATGCSEGRAFCDQSRAAFEHGIAGIAIGAGERQRVGIDFFHVTATDDAGGKSRVASLIEDQRAVIGQATGEGCGFLPVAQLQRGRFRDQRVTAISDSAPQR